MTHPSQPIGVVEPLVRFVDYVVLMTVEPGYAGQRFMADSLPRVSRQRTEDRRQRTVISAATSAGGNELDCRVAKAPRF